MTEKRKYFGQHGDDFLLWQLFDSTKNGYFIDIGAFDGIHLSNSYSFELAGWTGICVEALPSMYELCLQSRPGTTCIEAACIGDENTHEVKFIVEKLGLLSGVNVSANESDIRRRYEGRGIDFEGFEEITVPAKTLNTIIKEHMKPNQDIDFISIDVEGSEIDVLNGFDIDKYSPRCIVIEANNIEQEKAIAGHLTDKHSYILARKLGCNMFFTKNQKDAAILKHADINCTIEPTIHPLGEEYTLRDHVNGKAITSEISVIRRILSKVRAFGKHN